MILEKLPLLSLKYGLETMARDKPTRAGRPIPPPPFGQWLKRGIRQHRLWPQQYGPGRFTRLFGAGSSSVKWRILCLPCLLYRLNVKSKFNRTQKLSWKHKVSQTSILSIPIVILPDSRLHSKKRWWIKCPSVRILPIVLPAHTFSDPLASCVTAASPEVSKHHSPLHIPVESLTQSIFQHNFNSGMAFYFKSILLILFGKINFV